MGVPELIAAMITEGAVYVPSIRELNALRPQIAAAAQKIYDEAIQDPESGGICDEIATEIADILATNIADISIDEGGHDGDDHAWIMILDQNGRPIWGVDIPANYYERGGGYSWELLPDAHFRPEWINIWRI